MDLDAEKLKIIRWIMETDDTEVIQKLLRMKELYQSDWWETISPEERAEIEEGLAYDAQGNVYSHDEVMKRYTRHVSTEWDLLSDYQKQRIEESLKEAEAGGGSTLEEVNERVLKKYRNK